MRPPPSTLCAQGGFRPLECDVFGHLQRLQFYTGRLMTPFVIIILMVLVIITFVFRFSFKKTKTQPPLPLGFKPRCGEQGALKLVVALVPWLPTPRARWATRRGGQQLIGRGVSLPLKKPLQERIRHGTEEAYLTRLPQTSGEARL